MKTSLFVVSYLLSICAAVAIVDPNAPKIIAADKIEYNAKSKAIQTSGNTELTNTTGSRITLRDSYIAGQQAAGKEIELLLSENVRMTALDLRHDGNNTDATNATYTACWNCGDTHPAWMMHANSVHHDKNTHMMRFEDFTLKFYNVPVLWLPYMQYPDPQVKHKSGLLFPSMNSTNHMGSQFNFPLYVTLGEYHDFTLTFGYLTEEKPLWRLEHRLNMNRSNFRTTGSYTHNSAGDDRWHVFNNDLIELGANARAKIFLQRTSDQLYLQKYGFYDDQPYLDSGARVESFAENGYATAEAHYFQELRSYKQNKSNPSGDILPQLHGTYQTDPIFGLSYLTFIGDSLGISNNDTGMEKQRAVGAVRLTSPHIFYGQKITASISARYDAYNFKNADIPDGIKIRFLPSGYMDWQMPFVKNSKEWTHVIAPRIRLTLMDRKKEAAFSSVNDSAGALLSDATLFSDNRFSGYDVWENGSYLDFGANWSAYGEITNAEVFFGQSYDFNRQQDIDPNSGFHNGLSDFVGRASLTRDWLRLTNQFRFAKSDFRLRHLETMAKVGGRNYLEAGYIYATQFIDVYTLDHTIQEIVGGVGLHITSRWAIKGQTTFNVTDNRVQKQSGGIYYEHPCYTLSFEAKRDGAIRYDNNGDKYVGNTTFRIQFAMKINGDK